MTTTAWQGGPAGASAYAVLAPNPGPMTLEGTNTWVLRAPGAEEAVVVDPGPAGVRDHLGTVRDRAGAVALTLLTHHHSDHTGAVEEWVGLTGTPVRGAGRGAELGDGERLTVAGLDLELLHTPGHTADSVCIVVDADGGVLLSGDTVLGRGTSVVPWPEGDLTAYLASLDRLIGLARAGRFGLVAPAHGPVITEPLGFLVQLRDHRLQRLEQVRTALAGGAESAADVVTAVYGDLGETLTRAATATVRAQLAYLGHPTD